MLTSSNLSKLNKDGQIKRINTDDIPEGEFNKYALNYVDGKCIGDIVLRSDPTEKLAHARLEGRRIYIYESKLFVEWAEECKSYNKSEDDDYVFFTKTEKDYDDFLAENIFEITDEHYCPYFVVSSETINIYKVNKIVDGETREGYTYIDGESDTEVSEGYIYTDTTLEEVLTTDIADWFYTSDIEQGTVKYVRIPTYPTYSGGNTKSYYFIITNSRVDDNTTTFRTIHIGKTTTLEGHPAYVRNSGTEQNLVLDFGIPKGSSATIEIGEVSASEAGSDPEVENVGTDNDAILNFTLPRGEQGPAGGVVTLNYVQDTEPLTANEGEKFYDLTNNIIYTYSKGDWIEYGNADDGVIYVKGSIVYHYDKTNLIEFSNIVYVDSATIEKNIDGTLTAIGVKTKNNGVFYDWVGTLEEWELGRERGVIEDNWICFITDDE